MILPPPYPSEIRPRVRERLIGSSRSSKRVVLTPIPLIFRSLSTQLGFDPVDGGWWPSASNRDTLLVLTPQSTAVFDAICSLEPHTEIIFIGLAGSVGSLVPGDIVEIDTADLDGRAVTRTSRHQCLFPPARLAGVTSLAESVARWPTLGQVADCVDMETSYVYAASAAHGHFATAIAVISDSMPDRPFYTEPSHAFPDSTLKRLHRAVAELTS